MFSKKNIFTLTHTLVNVRFLLSAAVLIVCAVALNPAINTLSQHYGKRPIAIRKPLKNFDISKLTSFRDDWEFKHFSVPVKDLQTDEYVHLVLKARPARIPSLAQLYVTYYSNPAEKVGHTPEVCGRQAGVTVTKISTITLDTPQLAPDYKKIKARLLILKESNDYAADIYVLLVEGKFTHTREQARWTVGIPGNRYTYFSKIETSVVYRNPEDKDKAIQIAAQLLREALVELLAEHFPTIQQIKRP
jgi:hypothetical protein